MCVCRLNETNVAYTQTHEYTRFGVGSMCNKIPNTQKETAKYSERAVRGSYVIMINWARLFMVFDSPWVVFVFGVQIDIRVEEGISVYVSTNTNKPLNGHCFSLKSLIVNS